VRIPPQLLTSSLFSHRLVTADAQIMDFLCFSPFRRDSQQRTEVKLLRQRDCRFNLPYRKAITLIISVVEDFSGFQIAAQEILKTVPAKAQALFL